MRTPIVTRLLISIPLIAVSTASLAQSLPEQVKRNQERIQGLEGRMEEMATELKGRPGPPGPKGDRGPQGEAGPKGAKGDPVALDGIGFYTGFLQTFNGKGGRTLSIGTTTEEDSHARFWNRSGKEIAYIGSTNEGQGMVEVLGGGYVRVNGKNVHDYAEIFELATRDGALPGTVMSVVENGLQLAPAEVAYDPKVVGVISGAGGLAPGMRIGTREDGSADLPIAVSGQVYVRICLEGGPVHSGDLLVASSRRGMAMRASDRERAFGAVIGKALEPFPGSRAREEGLVRMLVMTR